MTMQPQEWSLNALSVEFHINRRSLARRLESVRPVSEKKVGNRIEKRWRLIDVMHLLGNGTRQQNDDEAFTKEIEDATHKLLKDFTFNQLMPMLLGASHFASLLTGYLRCEQKLSKRNCALIYRVAAGSLLWSTADFFEEPTLRVPKGSTFEALSGLTNGEIDDWIAKNWPDTESLPEA